MNGRLAERLLRDWAAPRLTPLTAALVPVAWAFSAVVRLRRLLYRRGYLDRWRSPVPVLVVGNLVAGGGGKTPVTIALALALRARGWRPGVVSRGHGREGEAPAMVGPADSARSVGDEPMLIHRRTGAPLAVGRDRPAAVRMLLQHQPQTDLAIADDGLQHLALDRDAEVIVFDARGVGNGRLLPAGPLREPLPLQLGREAFVLYGDGRPSTHLPGAVGQRRLAGVLPLAEWLPAQAPKPLQALLGQRCIAAAGIAQPQRFADMLAAAGIEVELLPLPDHHDFAALPWPAGPLPVIVTEKDAVKLDPARPGCENVWVAVLEQILPVELVDALDVLLRQSRRP